MSPLAFCRRIAPGVAAALVAAGLSVSGVARAQDADRTAEALARAQALLQQIGQQKAQLEAENAKLKASLARTEKTLEKTEDGLEATEAEVAQKSAENARLTGQLGRTEERLDRTKATLDALITKFKALRAEYQALQQAKAATDETLKETQEALKVSEYNNIQLYQVNEDLMAHLGDKGWSTMMLQKEPLTGLVDVKLQNIIEEYRAKQYEFLNPPDDDEAK